MNSKGQFSILVLCLVLTVCFSFPRPPLNKMKEFKQDLADVKNKMSKHPMKYGMVLKQVSCANFSEATVKQKIVNLTDINTFPSPCEFASSCTLQIKANDLKIDSRMTWIKMEILDFLGNQLYETFEFSPANQKYEVGEFSLDWHFQMSNKLNTGVYKFQISGSIAEGEDVSKLFCQNLLVMYL